MSTKSSADSLFLPEEILSILPTKDEMVASLPSDPACQVLRQHIYPPRGDSFTISTTNPAADEPIWPNDRYQAEPRAHCTLWTIMGNDAVAADEFLARVAQESEPRP